MAGIVDWACQERSLSRVWELEEGHGRKSAWCLKGAGVYKTATEASAYPHLRHGLQVGDADAQHC